MTSLDTTLLIDLTREQRRKRPGPASAKVRQLLAAGESLATTRINVAELRVGIARSTDRLAERVAVESTIAPLVILEVDDIASTLFGGLKAHLLNIGRFPGDFDVLIAAVCLAGGRRLVTRNRRHFADVPGLVIETY